MQSSLHRHVCDVGGTVLSCPGSEVAVEGSVLTTSLAQIWEESNNRARAGTFNCGCIAKDGKSIPDGFYDSVMLSVEAVIDSKRREMIEA